MAVGSDNFQLLISQIDDDFNWFKSVAIKSGCVVAGYVALRMAYRVTKDLYTHFGGSYSSKSRLKAYGDFAGTLFDF